MKRSQQKQIVVGVSAGIAAYKSCELARLLVKAGHVVQVLLTPNAKEFVGPLTFQALTGRPVFSNLFDLTEESRIGHISVADAADLVVIAPATADLLAKAALGFADNVVTTVLLATKAPVLFCPSMNVNMWNHPATQKNVATLKSYGYRFVDPENGELACGWAGDGRLAEPATIFAEIQKLL